MRRLDLHRKLSKMRSWGSRPAPLAHRVPPVPMNDICRATGGGTANYRAASPPGRPDAAVANPPTRRSKNRFMREGVSHHLRGEPPIPTISAGPCLRIPIANTEAGSPAVQVSPIARLLITRLAGGGM